MYRCRVSDGCIEVRKKDGESFVGNEIQESHLDKPNEYRLKALVEELQNNGLEYEKWVEINTEGYVLVCSKYRLYIQYDGECLIDFPVDEYLHNSIIEYFESEHYGFALGA